MENKYNLIIIGAGPAGLTASIYASRYRVNHVVVGELYSGLMTESHKICNFPTEFEISGMELVTKMNDTAVKNGMKLISSKVESVLRDNKEFLIKLNSGDELRSDTIVIATGTKHKKLNIPGENEFFGRGVTYCATCDGMFYKNKKVVVVGGGDSANTATLFLSDIAQKVYQVILNDRRKGEDAWIEQLNGKNNVETIYNTSISSILGTDKVERIELSREYNGSKFIDVDGVFLEIGTEPDVSIYSMLGLDFDEKGYIKVGSDMSTNVTGVWAAGDITTGSNQFRQIITACSEGAIAAESASRYLKTCIPEGCRRDAN